MKKILMIFLIVSSFHASYAADNEIETDKQLHFSVCFGISAMTYGTMDAYGYSKTQSTLTSLGVALAAGVAKEISDSQQANNRFDNNDMAYNLLGALTGTFLHWTF
jgi:uncharacterized protein YfiM (DUF2279 family)